jgi:predicted nuclease of predicted toxin-antitoxin system
MKLLLDHNLSPRLVRRLADLYPDISHVFLIGLAQVNDLEIWSYARANEYIIVTKDSDFSDISVLLGFPPKVIWLRLGNCTTSAVEQALRSGQSIISAFINDPLSGVLQLA